MNFGIDHVYSLLQQKLTAWLELAIKMLPNFVVATVVIMLFFGAARLVRSVLNQFLHKLVKNASISRLLTTVLYLTTLFLGIFTALSILNLDKTVTSLLAGAGVIGLALGFAFQDIAANFIAGILIAIRKPFAPGDLIETNEFFGTVDRINLRSTLLMTLQGLTVIIPNRDVFQKPLINYMMTKDRRVDLEVGVSYGDDLHKVKKVLEGTLNELPHQSKEKPVEVFFKEFGASSINLEARFWITSSDQKPYLEARSAGILAIKDAFDKDGITIPFPIRTLDFGIKGGVPLKDVLPESS